MIIAIVIAASLLLILCCFLCPRVKKFFKDNTAVFSTISAAAVIVACWQIQLTRDQFKATQKQREEQESRCFHARMDALETELSANEDVCALITNDEERILRAKIEGIRVRSQHSTINN